MSPFSHLKLHPIEPVPSTLGNELQLGILKSIRISNVLLFYLCVFATVRLLVVGN